MIVDCSALAVKALRRALVIPNGSIMRAGDSNQCVNPSVLSLRTEAAGLREVAKTARNSW